MWQVQATVAIIADHHHVVKQIPTFYLDEQVQGITHEAQAKRIAEDVIASVAHLALDGTKIPDLVISMEVEKID